MISSSAVEGVRPPPAPCPVTATAKPSDLDDDRQHQRAAAEFLVDELRDVVVQVLLEQRHLSDLLISRVVERVLDDVPELVAEAVGLHGERDPPEDHLRVGARRLRR